MVKQKNDPPLIQSRILTINDISFGIKKLQKRIEEVKQLEVNGVFYNDAQVKTVEANIRDSIRDIFGQNSPEFKDHQYHDIWHGPHMIGNGDYSRQEKFKAGITQAIVMLQGLIARLEEKKEDIAEIAQKDISKDFWDDIHPKISSIAKSRFMSKHYADAVESALKEVNNSVKDIVKKKTGKELDGAPLMNCALSTNNPIIVLDDLSTGSGKNVQQGYMQIFAGAMIGIRNPKAHDNLNITENRAIHFIYLSSLLMQKIDERI